ncbi:MAG: diguanylate cyclase [Azoarcus sp.]|nr:diguanylate cyclase [Azoarcus sp.]
MTASPPAADDDTPGDAKTAPDDAIWGVHSPALQALILCILYFVAARISVHLTITPGGVSLLWLPNAVILSALLVSDVRRWPWMLGAVIPGELAADWGLISIQAALGFGVVNLCEVLLAAAMLRRLHGRAFSLERGRHVASFGIIALLIAPGLAALVGSAIHAAPDPDLHKFWSGWLAWWLGDATGLLVLTPALHALWSSRQRTDNSASLRSWQGVAVVGGMAVVTATIFLQRIGSPEQIVVSPILIVPLMLGIAARFGVSGATWAGFTVALVAVSASVNGLGPYASLGGSRAILLVQEFVMLTALSGFVMAALLHEARRRGDRLRLFARAIDASDEGIAIADVRTGTPQRVFANRRYSRDGNDFLDNDARDAEAVARMRGAIADGRTAREIVHVRDSDGRDGWARMLLTPIHDGGDKATHYVAIEHDITDLIAAQRELFEAREALAAQNAQLERRVAERTADLERLATTDSLTGIHNRRYLLERAKQEISRSKRGGRALSLAMLDLDRFKHINDRFGHAFGDTVLIGMCEVVSRVLRPSDTLARFGGEEFVLLLPDTDAEDALRVAERVREAVAGMCMQNPQQQPVAITASLGLSTLGDDANDLDQLLRNADEALYRAKGQGRNCVVAAEAASAG